ncbi:secreted protein containing RagB/SusD domain protein [gut metagenome]|uniref:Secreted protein containing RagB/SusD domain protein n=1 Tax=gut metagenome TaxID=749906 RepID=J9GC67_9ZZZZ
MKKTSIFKTALASCLLAASSTQFSSCIEETFPQSSTATAEQIAQSPAAMQAMLNAVVGFINAYNTYGQSYTWDLGYNSYGIIREVMGEDFFIYRTGYDYYNSFGSCRSLADNAEVNSIYYYYYKFLNNVNNLIRLVDPETATETNLQYLGIAKVYRALIYMDMARLFEYKKTGFPQLDDQASQTGVYGLTVPIIYENITEAEARNNPRVPFYTMYDYILQDLNQAETLLAQYTRPSKDHPDLSIVAGLKARFWLELATRFEKYPSDLSALTSNVDLGIQSAQECYERAAQYARQAIDQSKALPLTELEWYGGKECTTAFNSILTSAWMWGGIMNKENIYSVWCNLAGHLCTEQTFGVGGINYGAHRMIGKALFDQIPDEDWRKVSWIDPADAGKAPGTKYHTLLNDATFQKLPAYVHLKFKPKEGNMNDANIGAPIDNVLMRVEEMYFIEAEALAASRGIGAGKTALENFMQTYRYPSYTCQANTLEEFREALLLQKRIEFWGEGIIYWDYKRLEKSVTRGYPGTNCVPGYRMNSKEGYVAPWFNLYFSKYESIANQAIILNPDPSSVVTDWSE